MEHHEYRRILARRRHTLLCREREQLSFHVLSLVALLLLVLVLWRGTPAFNAIRVPYLRLGSVLLLVGVGFLVRQVTIIGWHCYLSISVADQKVQYYLLGVVILFLVAVLLQENALWPVARMLQAVDFSRLMPIG